MGKTDRRLKIAVIGGGGVRTPQLVETLAGWRGSARLECLSLMDINPIRLKLIGGLCQQMVHGAGSPFAVQLSLQAEEALAGADHIITTIRVGEEGGRIEDERIALECGVIGQETVGAGGFAMAVRNIPAILEYARLAREICPQAWILNFTNPAGLVTQALQEDGYRRALGICDSANQARKEAAAWYRLPAAYFRDQVFGLNHLSWTRSLECQEREVLPELLADDRFLVSSRQRLFDPALVRRLGMYLNEYLYYYYYPELALRQISQQGHRRAELIAAWSQRLLEDLSRLDVGQMGTLGMQIYRAYRQQRSASYMDYAPPAGRPRFERMDAEPAGGAVATEDTSAGDLEATRTEAVTPEAPGYAGVALQVIEALEGGEPALIALNTPNRGAIAPMLEDDVVEVSCRVDANGVQPLPIGRIPERQELLMRGVKRFERLSVEALRARSRATAVEALMAHPLVASHSLASRLVERYLQVHAAFTGDWED